MAPPFLNHLLSSSICLGFGFAFANPYVGLQSRHPMPNQTLTDPTSSPRYHSRSWQQNRVNATMLICHWSSQSHVSLIPQPVHKVLILRKGWTSLWMLKVNLHPKYNQITTYPDPAGPKTTAIQSTCNQSVGKNHEPCLHPHKFETDKSPKNLQ